MRDVYIGGVGMTKFGKFLERNLKSLAGEAVSAALADAGTSAEKVGMVFFSNSVGGLISGQESIRGQVTLAGTGLDGKPMINVENACASASSAIHLARMAVASEEHEVAIAVGAEKLYHQDRGRTFRAMMSAVDVERIDEIQARLGYDADSSATRSIFMDVYAEMARRLMERTGATACDFAQVAVKSHEHAADNPRAQFRDRVTVDEVLASREIVEPLTLLMCSPIGDGAAAVVVCSEGHARRNEGQPVRIRANVLLSGQTGTYGETVPAAAHRAYEQAGFGPEELNAVELHDATAPAELILYEDLGLCAPGDAAKMLWAGETALGGRVPVNPSGGLISKGHPVGASGCAQLVELTEQLRGRSGPRQIEGARVALAQNAGGFLDPDVAACTVTILSVA